MKNFTIAFLVFLVWSFFGLWFYHWIQSDTLAIQSMPNKPDATEINKTPEYNKERLPLLTENESNDVLERPVDTEATVGLKATTEQGDLLFMYPENFQIKKNTATVFIPPSTQDFKYKLQSYLLKHPNTELVVVSKYSAEENIETTNFGMQRAKKIKAILVDAGVAAQRIVLKPHITPIEFHIDDSYNNAFSFTIQPLDLERLENIKNAIPETKTIYPRFSSSGILTNPALEIALEEVKLAMETNPNITVTVVGHTDNIGNATDNYTRGLEFAQQIRWYFIVKGNISKDKIRAASEGEAHSIASNQTEKGRALNQRIELRFNVD